MDLPFKVSIITEQVATEMVLPFFAVNDINEIPVALPQIKEYSTFVLNFTSLDAHDRLIVDVPETPAIESTDGFKPNAEKIVLYNAHDSNFNPQTEALIPGFYSLAVQHAGQIYLSGFEIILKDLSVPEWITMREEIEKMAGGLASEFVTRQQVRMAAGVSVTTGMDAKAALLLAAAPRIKTTIEKLRHDAKFEVHKQYHRVPMGQASAMDTVTIRKMQQRPNNSGCISVPKRIQNYDIIENQWLAYIIRYFIQVCQTALQTQQPLTKQELRPEMVTYNQQLKSLHAYLRQSLTAGFLADVTPTRPKKIPKALILNPKYSLLYRLFKTITTNTDQFQLEKQYQKFWKRTDLLYEIWVYIKTLQVFLDSGYTPLQGWIFDPQIAATQEIPFLNDGTRVVFEKDDLQIAVTYNEAVNRRSFALSLTQPVVISSGQNKPDIRIDILHAENHAPKQYMGTIIVDSKYKKLKSIIGHNDTDTLDQLMNYRYLPYTTANITGLTPLIANSIRPVEAVIAVYPNQTDKKVRADYTHQQILFAQLKPTAGMTEYIMTINQLIKHRVEMYQALAGLTLTIPEGVMQI